MGESSMWRPNLQTTVGLKNLGFCIVFASRPPCSEICPRRHVYSGQWRRGVPGRAPSGSSHPSHTLQQYFPGCYCRLQSLPNWESWLWVRALFASFRGGFFRLHCVIWVCGSLFFLSRIIENDFFKQDWRTRGKLQIFQYIFVKWLLCFLIGLIVSLIGFFNNLAVENIAGVKFVVTSNMMLLNRY